MNDRRQSPSGKTFRESCKPRTTPSAACSEAYLDSKKPLHRKVEKENGITRAFFPAKPSEWVGGSLMQNSLPWLKGAGESFSLPCRVPLSSVLEREHVHPKYFLSPKACSGILRRAIDNGKKLPEALLTALLAGAQSKRASEMTGQSPGVIAFNSNAQGSQLPSCSRDTSIADTLTTSQRGAVAFTTSTRALPDTASE